MRAETVETDVLVIGGGAAGSEAALKAHDLGAKVLMVVKGKMGRSGATPLAAFLPAVPHTPGPYSMLSYLKKIYSTLSSITRLPIPPIHAKEMRDMLANHFWLGDQDYFIDVALWADKEFYPSIENSGLYLLRDESGTPVVSKRSPYYTGYQAGMSGYQYGESKRKEVLARGITVMEETAAFSLLKGKAGHVAGAIVLDYVRGNLYAIRAKSTILATGHTNWLSKRSTGTREMAANGLAMAARVGAELQNLEIQWFHASDTAYPDSWMRMQHYPNPLIGTPHQAVMVNSDGEVYMNVEDHDAEIPYTIQMKELYKQVKQGKARWDGGNFTDYRLVDPEVLEKYQYNWEFYQKLGQDMSKDSLESGVTWHMSAGGVRANLKNMETGVPGLFIAGPVGGHVLGGIPLAAHDGALAGTEAARRAQGLGHQAVDEEQVGSEEQRVADFLSSEESGGIPPIQIKRRIRETVWDNMMFVRTEAGLNQVLGQLAAIQDEMVPHMRLRTTTARYNTDLMDALDVQDMLDVCEMVAHACMARQESRGPHFREDFPFTDNTRWLKHVVVSKEGDRVKTRLEPIRQKYLKPRREMLDYFANPQA